MGETRYQKDKKNDNRVKAEDKALSPSTQYKASLPDAFKVQHYVGCNCGLCNV